jgi:hypothetical protein
MVVVNMARKRGGLSERKLLRSIETFSNRVSAGMAVIVEVSKTKQEAVTKISIKIGRSERYVWNTVKLGSKLHATISAILEKEANRNKRLRPRTVATIFLLRELRNKPRPMKEIEALAGDSGIAISTLRRTCKVLGVKKKRIGGRNGFWIWELPSNTKINFGIDD